MLAMQLTAPQFSSEKVALFEKRYEEGYDLYDEEYEAWLQHFHSNGLQSKRMLWSGVLSSWTRSVLRQ